MDFLSSWTADELLMQHSKAVDYLLSKLQAILAGGLLRATGFLALFYAAVLFTEGIGVYMQQRWAEWLMIFATAALIPLEGWHIWHHPSLAAVVILIVNCFIVWFLYLVLRRKPNPMPAPVERELAKISETRGHFVARRGRLVQWDSHTCSGCSSRHTFSRCGDVRC